MNRLINQEDGTWRLVDDRHRKICEFKIGDEVKGESNPHSWIDDVIMPFKGKVMGILYMKDTIGLLITYKQLLSPGDVPDICVLIGEIEKMEVIE